MTTLDLSILGLLADQPLHGYELKKRLASLTDGRASVSFGSLYPALNRLDRTALITTSADTDKPRIPMTGSLGAEIAALRGSHDAHPPAPRGRRNRKVYRITDAGRSRLLELLTTPGDDDRAFSTQLAFAQHLNHTERLALLERRRTELRSRLTEEADTPGARPRDRYRSAARDRGRIRTSSELQWLDTLIAEENTLGNVASVPTGAQPPIENPLPQSVVGGS